MSIYEKENCSIGFTKMSGHGNTFIVIDNFFGSMDVDWSEFASAWCRYGSSIDADGLLVIESSMVSDFMMRIFNSDGSEAEMCGNGARCASKFAFEKGMASSQMTIETLAGIIGANVEGEIVSINLTDTKSPGERFSIDVGGTNHLLYSINSGVPHAITFKDHVAEMSADDVKEAGYAIRFHPVFEPEGTNVDFVEVVGSQVIRVRAYERGVEAETQACGTGAVAAAIVSYFHTNVGKPPIAVQMPGGILIVDFKENGSRAEDVWLSGEVKSVYCGKIEAKEVCA